MDNIFIKKGRIFWSICFSATVSLFVFFFAANAWGFKFERLLVNFAFFCIIIAAMYICHKLKCGNRILVVLLATFTYIPNIIVLSYLIMDHSIMRNTDFWVVFDTNSAEAAGFFAGIPTNVFIWSALYTIICIITGYQSLEGGQKSGRVITHTVTFFKSQL